MSVNPEPVTRPPERFIGVDFGTSGCRAVVIDAEGTVYARAAQALPVPHCDGARCEQDPALWWDALCAVLDALLQQVPAASIAAIAVDGTSATLLPCDAAGTPLGPALLYNDARAVVQAQRIRAVAPPQSGAQGVTSSLAKLLHLRDQGLPAGFRRVLHQADWLGGRLCGCFEYSDENNVLKLGFDAVHRVWPAWLASLGVAQDWLPRVVPPGTPLGTITPAVARRFGFCPATRVVAGTTDSTAACIAAGLATPGDALTSLGSTLVLKVLATRPVFAPEYGVYSHRLGDLWLVGGASNSGGAVLRQFFDQDRLDALTSRLQPDHPTGLDYYPLPAPGERFPVNDPACMPRLTPRPADDVIFLQGLLEGIARIEAHGYRLLERLGAPYPTTVRSVGGGAANLAWREIRAQLLGVPVTWPTHGEAACGAALLAARAA